MTDKIKQLVEELYEESQDNPDNLYWKAAAVVIERLSAENEEFKRDAERWRKFEEMHNDPEGNVSICLWNSYSESWTVACQYANEFIDSAITAQGEVKS